MGHFLGENNICSFSGPPDIFGEEEATERRVAGLISFCLWRLEKRKRRQSRPEHQPLPSGPDRLKEETGRRVQA